MPVRRNVPVVDLSAEPLSRLPGVGPRVAEKLAARTEQLRAGII